MALSRILSGAKKVLSFNDTLLADFANQHYGYGNFKGDFWFVGMEEGGGDSFQDIERRLQTWAKRGKLEVDDVAEYHIDLGITSLFRERPRIQTTWGGLIRILMAARGQTPTTDAIREYQRDSLGRAAGETCLLELLPLPSPSTSHWLYRDYSKLPFLADRQAYRQALLSKRMAHLRERIRQHQPRVVVFYGYVYQQNWRDIAGADFTQSAGQDFYLADCGSQVFVIMKHPAATGLRNDYFHRVGRAIASELETPGRR